MARNLGINIKIGADLKNFSKDMQNVSRQMKKTGQKMQSLGKSMSAALTLPLAAAGVAMIKFASDTEESLNKVDVAFGESSKEVQKFAETTLKSFGIARGTALDMAATFGDMATSMGLPQGEASKMSTSLVGLAGDLASFKNIRIDVAKTALNSIFTGETESLKSLGIVMTQANLSAFALEKGIQKPIKAMSEGEKTMLRYQFVMAKTSNAQGDFARTGGGAANQMRIFQEGLKELAEKFGSLILPMFTKVVSKLNEAVAWFSGLDVGIKKTILVVAGLAAAAGPLLLALGSLMTMLPAIKLAFAGMGGPISLVVIGLTAIAAIIIKNWDKIAPKLQEVANYFTEIYNESLGVRIGVQSLVLVFKGLFRVVKFNLQNIWTAIKTFGRITADVFGGLAKLIKGALTFNADDLKGGLSQLSTALSSNVKKAFSEIKDNAKSTFEDIKGDMSDFVDNINKKKKPIVIPVKLKVDTGGTESNDEGIASGGKGRRYFEDIGMSAKKATTDLLNFNRVGLEVPKVAETMGYSLQELAKAGKESLHEFSNSIYNALNASKQMLGNFISDSLGGFLDALGQEMAGSSTAIDRWGEGILKSFGSFLGELGSMIIAAGTASLIAQTALFGGGPAGAAAAIAAGAALVVIGGAIKQHTKGVGEAISGDYGSSGMPISGGYSGYGTNNSDSIVTLESVVYGNDILLSSNRASNTQSRTRRK